MDLDRYFLGQFDSKAYKHGREVVNDMRRTEGIKGGIAHSVTVAVYVDGYLQFAGSDACVCPEGYPFDRMDARLRGEIIIKRMNPAGEIAREVGRA